MIISALFGGALGFISKTYLSRLNFKQSTIGSIVARHLDARDEICKIVATCSVKANADNTEWIKEIGDSLSLVYYQYYDYMPKEVIREFICLRSCLKDPENKLYTIKNEYLCTLNNEDEVETFCRDISLLDNISHAIYYNLHNGTEVEIRSRRIEYQARHLLTVTNMKFTKENLTSLSMFKPKMKRYIEVR